MISSIVLTHNEEKNIVDCLESLSFCSEIIVVDDKSYDRTLEIAKSMGAKTFIHDLNNNFSQQRNFALSRAKSNWVLFLDADERISPKLKGEILEFIKNPKDYTGAHMPRSDFMWGRKLRHGETGNLKFLRLAKKNAGKWVGSVHEEWIVQGPKITFVESIIHYPHQNIAEFLKEINRYTDIRAKELYEKKIFPKWYQIIGYPLFKFIQNFIIRLGFLDGIAGLIMAIMMSFHSFLVRGKLWLLWQKK